MTLGFHDAARGMPDGDVVQPCQEIRRVIAVVIQQDVEVIGAAKLGGGPRQGLAQRGEQRQYVFGFVARRDAYWNRGAHAWPARSAISCAVVTAPFVW
jgi:hypothetical protein